MPIHSAINSNIFLFSPHSPPCSQLHPDSEYTLLLSTWEDQGKKPASSLQKTTCFCSVLFVVSKRISSPTACCMAGLLAGRAWASRPLACYHPVNPGRGLRAANAEVQAPSAQTWIRIWVLTSCWASVWPWSVKLLSQVRLFATPWTIACQALLSIKFSRQECWSGKPFPSPRDQTLVSCTAGGFFIIWATRVWSQANFLI